MRRGRISLFAIMAILVVSGCSASRSSLRPDDREDDGTSVPPRHDLEYSPEPFESDEESRNPVPPVPSGEPVPAPPATGVSRVKSVSWFRDLGAKIHGKPAPCGSECGDNDESLIGQCSPIEPCAPETECDSRMRVERYRETVCEGRITERINPARSIGKSISTLFHKREPVPCSEECAENLAPTRRCVPAFDDSCAASSGSRTTRRNLHSEKRPGCLADPLDDPAFDESDPGLITPGDLQSPRNPETVPDVPVPDHVPASPDLNSPESSTPPVPGVPKIPAPMTPSTQVVEPPAWPRLGGSNSVRQVSQPAPYQPSGQPHTGSAMQLPQVVPKIRR